MSRKKIGYFCKKQIVKPCICAVLIILCSMAVYAYASIPSVFIGNDKVSFTSKSGFPFTDESGHLQVPLRTAMEAFGCKVAWNESENTAVLTKDGITVLVPLGESYIVKNGVKQTTNTAARSNDGKLYLPIRPVVEAFGGTVEWDIKKNAVLLFPDTVAGIPPEGLSVHFIDVGQADSIFIDNGEYEVLIDGGNNQDGKNVTTYLKNYIDGPLELMIATHPDADHIGGLDGVLDAYTVEKIIDSGEQKDTKTWKDYWQAVEMEQNAEIIMDEDVEIDLGGGVTLNIIETGDGYADSNDNSVVAQLNYGDVSLLLTGDMEKTAEAAALNRFGKVTVLKAGHHGSRTSSSQAFLEKVKPEYVILSAGKDNSYHHPHQAVLERYQNIAATVYATFRSGTIVMKTDGKTVSFDTNDPVVLADAGDYSKAS